MIDYVHKGLFSSGSVKKQLILQIENGETITNNRIYQEGFELTESLCSGDRLAYGCCEASKMSVKIRNEFGDLVGKKIAVSMVVGGNTDNPLKIGTYKVDSSSLSGDKLYANLTAYDSLYDVINANYAEWYESLSFPLTLKAFRDSFFQYVGIQQEVVSLIQDDVLIEKTVDAEEISGLAILKALCELNGVFGHINRNDVFTYVSLKTEMEELYPSEELFPSNLVLPGGSGNAGEMDIPKNQYISCTYEEFVSERITKLQIRQEENDIGVVYGTGDNCYVVEDNFLVYGKDEDELLEIAERLYAEIYLVKYRPYNASVLGNPCLEVGDSITIHTKNCDVESYVLNRTLKGIQALRDSISASGEQRCEDNPNSVTKDIIKLKSKTNVLERNLDSTKSEIKDVENGLSNTITQTASSLEGQITSVSKEVSENKDAVDEEIKSIQKDLSLKATSEELTLQFNKIVEDGVEKVETSTGYTFDEDGLSIEKSGSEMKTKITENGMYVSKDGEEVLVANNEGVDAVNLHATTYLIVGMNSRFEDYGDGRTGCFWIGGNN